MATVYGSKVNNIWRAYMTYTVTTTPTQVKVSITSGLNIPNDGYYSARSFTCTISGTGQTTVSGSIPSKKYTGVLTKAIKSVTYTWNRASTAQTKTIKTVLKGNGESTTSSCSAKITIPALAPATITFNANDGSGTVPSAISTYVGVANTIPSNSLTRTGYTFNGWNTASDGSGTAYATGSTITPTGDVTLYAQWQTTYVKPEIQNLLAFRVADKSGGATPTVTSTGETGFCKFDLVGGANYTFDSASVQFGTATANSMTQSGTTLYGYSEPNSIAQTSAYTVKITVVVTGTDGISRTYTDSTYISKSVPVFDAANNGNCFALFGTAIDGLTSPKLIINGELALGTALSIANGGTGATTAAAARSNLGIKGCHKIRTSLTGAAGSYTYNSIGKHMIGTDTAYLEEKISDQLNGIILVWSFYNGEVKNLGWNFTVIPKPFIDDHSGGTGMSTFMVENSALGNVGAKYLYVRDDRIIGNDTNSKAGTGTSAIKYANNKFVLRWVYGF